MAKPGPRSVNPSSKGTSPSGAVAGSPGKSVPMKPFEGPSGKGPPIAMRKALSRKAPRGPATGFAGTAR